MTDSKEIRKNLSDKDRILIKVGTNCLTNKDSELEERSVRKLVGDLMDLIEAEKKVVLVTSGAIGAGIGRLSLEEMPEDMKSLQAASTVGQSELMRKYSESFEEYGHHVAQLLLTREDFTNSDRFQNLKNTLKTLFDWGVIPIINENDAVAVEEIRMGDNDLLSAYTAIGSGADLMIILTDVDGLYTDDPKKKESVEPIRTVEKVTPEIEKLTEETTGGNFGGMYTKVQSAKIATEEGIPVIVTKASKKKVLKRILEGEEIGTLFLPQEREV